MTFAHHKSAVIRRSRKKYELQEAAIEVILANPEKTRAEQAKILGIPANKFTKVVNDPDFETLRQERLSQLIDPILKETLEKKLYTTSIQAVDVVSDELTVNPTMGGALATLKVTTTALGLQNRREQPAIQNNIQIAWLPTQE